MKSKIIEQLKKAKSSAQVLSQLEEEKGDIVLNSLAKALRKSSEIILRENLKDLANMPKDDPMYDRLLLTEERIQLMAKDVESVAHLNSPLRKLIETKTLENGLKIERIVVPLGVVAVIYESRPNVTIDVFSLCFKTRNTCVLKGGKEAAHSNAILVKIIHEVLLVHDVDPNIVYLLAPDREATQILLNSVGLVDVCIPRGGKSLINFVRENSRIPVIETGAGIVHTYFDESADLEKGRRIINNAKTRRVSVCNALDCLIIHDARLHNLFELVKPLVEHSVEIYVDEKSFKALSSFYPHNLLHKAGPEHFGQEFLSYKMAIKTVSSADEAIDHIMKYTSGHSEAIISEDKKCISNFLSRVDAAAVYVNASTAFTDGGQFGLGAEIGISTQKLHARGPMGLDALTSYKWLIHGDGHIRV